MDDIVIPPEVESNKEKKLLRRTKKHDVDFYNLIKDLPVTMTLEEAIKTFPPAKQQIRAGIANLGPGFTMVETPEIQQLEKSPSDDSSEYSSNEEFSDSTDESDSDAEARKRVQKKIENIQKKDKTYKTSAYLDVLVQSIVGRGIADTGAGKTVISEAFMDRLGWSIDKPTNVTFTVATGEKAAALGVVKNVPITVGGLTIPISAIVSTSTSYDILLGNDWLIKANAVVDLANTTLTISAHNQEVSVNINLDHGARSSPKAPKGKRNFDMNQVEVTSEQDPYDAPWDTWPNQGAPANWLTEEVHIPGRMRLSPEDEKNVLPSTKRWRENFKKQRCHHGYPFYHAEASCISCDLETVLLDKEFLKAKDE